MFPLYSPFAFVGLKYMYNFLVSLFSSVSGEGRNTQSSLKSVSMLNVFFEPR